MSDIVTVREFSRAPDLNLDFEVLQGREGIDNEIRSPRIQKLGLALAGFSGYIHPDRVQVMGASELNYLRMLEPAARLAALQHIGGLGICCVVLLKGLEAPQGLVELGLRDRIPILRTGEVSSVAVVRITDYLERRLAPHMTVHGVLVEVYGLGVMLLGASGIGKSECALELILRGHRLVADDSVELTRRGADRLVGGSGEVLKHHIELRGLGVLSIKDLFGISATAPSQSVDLAVELERWRPEAEYDRLGLDQPVIEFMGVAVPLVKMPVAPGRNLAALVEVAARIQLLRRHGYRPAAGILDSQAANPEPGQPSAGGTDSSGI